MTELQDIQESGVPNPETACEKKSIKASCQVNRQLIFVKMNYFCQYYVIATLFLYVNPILVQSGLTASQLGFAGLITNAFTTCARLISGPVLDRTKKKNMVITTLSIITAVLVLCLFGLPKEREHVFEGQFTEDGFFLAEVKLNHTSQGNNISSISDRNETDQIRVCWPSSMAGCVVHHHTAQHAQQNLDLVLVSTNNESHIAKYSVQKLISLSSASNWIHSRNKTTIKCSTLLTEPYTGCIKIQSERIKKAAYLTVVLALFLRTLLSCAHAPILNLLDSITFGILGKAKSQFYGCSRLFGSLGYIVGSLLTGVIISKLSDIETSSSVAEVAYDDDKDHYAAKANYAPSILMGAGFACAGALAALFSSQDQSVTKREIRKAFSLALRSPEMIKCVINCLLTGLAISLVGEYFTLIMTLHYGLSHQFLGALISIIILTEVPIFLATGSLVRRFGPTLCLSASHFVWTVWFASLTYFANPWVLLVAQAWSGLAFPLAYNSVLHQAAEAGQSLGEGGLVASMQAIAVAVLCGLAQCIGGLGWGILLDYLPGRQLFALAACYTFIVMLTIPIFAYVVTKICKYRKTP